MGFPKAIKPLTFDLILPKIEINGKSSKRETYSYLLNDEANDDLAIMVCSMANPDRMAFA